MLPRRTAKAALVLVAAVFAATTGAAFADSLPEPAQGVAADVLERVGLDLPRGEEGAEEAQERAEAKQAAAAAYAGAVRTWTACVADAASRQGDESARTVPFDPEGKCGQHPRPQDFGLTAPVALDDLPEGARAGRARAEQQQSAAMAYAEAVQDWTDCVAKAASAQGDESVREEDFSPQQACGAHPSPGAFGLGGDEAENGESTVTTREEPPEGRGRPPGVGRPEPTTRPEPEGARRPERAVPNGPPPRGERGAPPPPGTHGGGPPPERPDARRPPDAGAPAQPAPQVQSGPPADAGPPDDAGPPRDAGPPGGVGG